MKKCETAILLYSLFASLLIFFQPRAIFRKGKPVPIGLGRGKTLFHMQTVMIFLALFSLILATKLDTRVK